MQETGLLSIYERAVLHLYSSSIFVHIENFPTTCKASPSKKSKLL